MAGFAETLIGLGIAEYCDRFIAEGFDSWDTLLDIQESDLEALNVKLGHRRKLQRAIAEAKQEQGLPSLTHQTSNGSSKESPKEKTTTDSGDQLTTKPKRRYKRHPKPDPYAPERPVSAYVLFSNDVRERLKSEGQDLNFCDMAKTVGEQWQNLAVEERESYEAYASARKSEFNSRLSEYKKTEQYREYQKYLAEFKASHGDLAAHPDSRSSMTKRSKLRHENSSTCTETSISSRPGSIASPSSLSVHSDNANGRPDFPTASSPGKEYYGPVKQSPSVQSTPLGSNRPDARMNALSQAPYSASEVADSYTRRRSSSYTLGLVPPPVLASRPFIPEHGTLSLPPIRTTADPPMPLRSLPPPIPSLVKASSLGAQSILRKQDPMDALIAAAESQAPRLPMPGNHPRG